ncbi:si:dkey-100n23.5 isoform X5 [Syngnathus typhle]|uniref:si:dkey-100n23.5 isoform X5 n=1 Tax=Syngnathus typhle TaxID=161592 RepID=UPI002A6AC809|nr:si:dkey-100n23.5 isoform X5 [Syngnathus typhle]
MHRSSRFSRTLCHVWRMWAELMQEMTNIVKAVILTVKRATGTFSLVGCMFMLFVIWLLRRYHSLAQKMILSLTVAAFFDSLAYVMGESHPEGPLCDFQAWWLTYFDWSALAWVCLITLNLYFNLVREKSTNTYETFYHLIAWGVPLVMSSLPLFKGYYGPAGAWCWITDDHVAWRFGIWYVPLFTLILLMICCYARIICVANNRMQSWLGTFNPERERRKVSLAEEIKPLKWYPSVYLLVSIFPLINRLHNALYPLDPSFSLTLLHVLSAPLHGLANAFVFGLDRDWRSLLSPTGMQGSPSATSHLLSPVVAVQTQATCLDHDYSRKGIKGLLCRL